MVPKIYGPFGCRVQGLGFLGLGVLGVEGYGNPLQGDIGVIQGYIGFGA